MQARDIEKMIAARTGRNVAVRLIRAEALRVEIVDLAQDEPVILCEGFVLPREDEQVKILPSFELEPFANFPEVREGLPHTLGLRDWRAA